MSFGVAEVASIGVGDRADGGYLSCGDVPCAISGVMTCVMLMEANPRVARNKPLALAMNATVEPFTAAAGLEWLDVSVGTTAVSCTAPSSATA